MRNLQLIITLVLIAILLANIAEATKGTKNILEFAQTNVTNISCRISDSETSLPPMHFDCSGARLQIFSNRRKTETVAKNFLELVHQNAAATKWEGNDVKPKQLNFYVFGEFSFEDLPGTYELGFGQGSFEQPTTATNNWWFGGPSCQCEMPLAPVCYCRSTDGDHPILLVPKGSHKVVVAPISTR
mmetsp:Transcript_2704/g.3875  ORF Transcript_2704/g.3875 Transcript_2704/m.3875 type:complete len:186 (+) Transcript_2704:382-939(+)